MKKTLFSIVSVAACLASTSTLVVAQASAAPKSSTQDVGVAAARDNWRSTLAYITAAANELSEADYAYRPIATVRTFGGLIGHIAGSQNMYCSKALGDKEAGEDDVEKSAKSKADLVKALRASNEYCAKAYAISAANAAMSADLFGSQSTRLGALIQNAVHNGEHYGNIVTYMRMKGMTPPSSKR
jgi:uncharacterized damage-inducible protein DinB